jgi:hypothetical protein
VRVVQGAPNLSRGRDDKLEAPIQVGADRLNRAVVGRVRDSDKKLVAVRLERDCVMEAGDLFREHARRFGIDPPAAQADERKALLTGQQAGEILLVDPAFLQEHLAEAPPTANALLERGLELVLAQEAGAIDERAEGRVRALPPFSPVAVRRFQDRLS